VVDLSILGSVLDGAGVAADSDVPAL